MKKILATFLCVVLLLSNLPVHVYAVEYLAGQDNAHWADEMYEQTDSSQKDLQSSVEKTFKNIEYGYILTVTPVDTEIELKSGTAMSYSLRSIDADKT